MTARRRTLLLILLLIATAVACPMTWSMMDTRREAAALSQDDLATCQREWAEMNLKSGADPNSTTEADPPINRELRSAAIAAQVPEQLASIDPGTAARVADSDYLQTPVFVRLNAVTLRQLVEFLHELSATDSSLRSTEIELSPALTAAPNRSTPGEAWTADLTISHLAYAPQSKAGR